MTILDQHSSSDINDYDGVGVDDGDDSEAEKGVTVMIFSTKFAPKEGCAVNGIERFN